MFNIGHNRATTADSSIYIFPAKTSDKSSTRAKVIEYSTTRIQINFPVSDFIFLGTSTNIKPAYLRYDPKNTIPIKLITKLVIVTRADCQETP